MNVAGKEFDKVRKWIATQINNGATWDEVIHFCVDENHAEDEFERLQDEDMIIPPSISIEEWPDLVKTIQNNYSDLEDTYFITDNLYDNHLPVPTDAGSPWVKYKDLLLGRSTGKPRMSDAAVAKLEENCIRMLNQLSRDTRAKGSIKGLVMGSVQSGKTANMIGLVTMAAHYDWNIFIVLSGSIDNLRKQTRDRFNADLTMSGGVSWHVLDYTRGATYLVDINDGTQYMADDLKLNLYQEEAHQNDWLHRYVIVCLKNSVRLRNLIKWLHSNTAKAARMRILLIDDEADQASINTKKMNAATDEDEIERTSVNQLIIDLVKGNNEEGGPTNAEFQAMNYVSFTATPYANVLNEAYHDSLYPRSFICSLPESKEYFGAKAIWGSKDDENYNGLNIIRTVPDTEIEELKCLHEGDTYSLPIEYQKSVCWFLCAAAILRLRGHKKPISMLIHTTGTVRGHFEEYYRLKGWLDREIKTGRIYSLCKYVYEIERREFSIEDLKEGYPEYAAMEKVNPEYPEYNYIRPEIERILTSIINIEMDNDKQFTYCENAIHLCVDNSRAKREADEGTYLRIVYPTSEQLDTMKKAPVFVVLGGNTLARGLTLEGLVCTYFARNVNQADTLMQMARWFGYRHGYELLQRIWMPESAQEKFGLLEEIDEKLKAEIINFEKKHRSPDQFGPRIMNSSQIAKFTVTSKNKSQNAVGCDFDFSGDSYETTRFSNDEQLLTDNIKNTELFLTSLGMANKSDVIAGSYVWRNVPSNVVIDSFISRYRFDKDLGSGMDLPYIVSWIQQMNEDGEYLKWNVAVAGNSKSSDRWHIAGADVGKVERSKLKRPLAQYPDLIDIKSLRSGLDALSDVQPDLLTEEAKKLLNQVMSSKEGIIAARSEFGLSENPLLLIYRIDKDKGKESASRTKIASAHDVIGFSIIIAGDDNLGHVRTIWIKMPESAEK